MSHQTFATSIDDRYLEDYVVGAAYEFGSIPVDASEVVKFGQRFDPQPFHTDPEAAKQSSFGGLIASGWHTASLMMRLFVDNYLTRAASLGSPGVDELRWLKPVRPGDDLTLRVTVIEASRSRSKPDRGILRSYVEVLNQDRDVVVTMVALNVVGCRETHR
jgi:acyl dehydratase